MDEIIEQSAQEQDALRAEVRTVVDEAGGNFAAATRDCPTKYPTLSAWYNGTYQGRNDRVAAEVRRWLDTRLERARSLSSLPRAPAFLETPSARSFLDVFAHAHHAPDLVIVTGGPGVGKTSACQAYTARNAGVLLCTGQPSVKTPRALLEELADVLEVRERGPSQRIARSVIRRLQGQPSVILYDEAQHLTTEALDQLRSIHDIAGIGIALVGNETIYPRLEGIGRTAQFAQLFSRIGMKVPRPKPLRGDVDVLLDAWGVPGERERKALHAIAKKPGALRSVTKVLRQATMASRMDGSEHVSVAHLHDAYARLSSTPLTLEEAA